MSRNAHIYRRIWRLPPLLAAGFALLPGLLPGQVVPSPTPVRARVVMVEDTHATDAFKPQPDVVRALVHRGMTNFAGRADLGAAWRTLVGTQDVVGIKVFSTPGAQVGTRADVVAGVVEGLLAAKIPTNHIIIWDRQVSSLRTAGFDDVARAYGVRLAGSVESGWDEDHVYEFALLGQLTFGDHEFQKKEDGVGRKSHVTRLLTRTLTKVINVTPLLNHNTVGVCGNLYSMALGSVDNTIRFEGNPGALSEVVPDIYALPVVGDRVVLSIVDALICQYQGEQSMRLHNSVALNQLRFSTDPVALDVLSLREINTQRLRAAEALASRTNRMDLYRNAELLWLGASDADKIELRAVKDGE